jgi:hypothetical protein
MTIRRALVASLVATSCFLPVSAAAAIPLQVHVTVVAGDGMTGFSHVTAVGFGINIEVLIRFENFAFLDAARADSEFPVDIYVDAIRPDGRFTSWVGQPLGSTFVTGQAPVPLLTGVIPEVGSKNAYRWINFSTGSPPGWYVLYGIVVRAGANPLDPREWAGWYPAAFYPLLVTP